jgi:hypothetical protein
MDTIDPDKLPSRAELIPIMLWCKDPVKQQAAERLYKTVGRLLRPFPPKYKSLEDYLWLAPRPPDCQPKFDFDEFREGKKDHIPIIFDEET